MYDFNVPNPTENYIMSLIIGAVSDDTNVIDCSLKFVTKQAYNRVFIEYYDELNAEIIPFNPAS